MWTSSRKESADEKGGMDHSRVPCGHRPVLFNDVGHRYAEPKFDSRVSSQFGQHLFLDRDSGFAGRRSCFDHQKERKSQMRLVQNGSLFIVLGMALFPGQSFAEGEAGGHQASNNPLGLYVLAGWGLLAAVLWILYAVNRSRLKSLNGAKKKEDRLRRERLTVLARLFKWSGIVSLIGLIVSAVILSGTGEKQVVMTHIHGVGYSGDGRRILVPAHDGIKVYEQGVWSAGLGEKHDYMGFSMADDRFYSSGHPAPGSNKKNPFGLIKSTDEGKTIETLALSGEVDFHLMNVSYKTHTIYVYNPQPNSAMKAVGLYYSKDEAKTWKQAEMKGLSGEPAALAVHPTNDAVVAVGTKDGLYMSRDYGQTFEKTGTATQVTALYFGPQGELFVGSYGQGASLARMNVQTKQKFELTLPAMTQDAVAYVAQNPVDTKQLVIATFNKDVYLSNDGGTNWTKIADRGKGISQSK